MTMHFRQSWPGCTAACLQQDSIEREGQDRHKEAAARFAFALLALPLVGPRGLGPGSNRPSRHFLQFHAAWTSLSNACTGLEAGSRSAPMHQKTPLHHSMSAPVRASLNLQPLLPVAAPTAHNTTSPRSLLRRHTRRLVLASLAAFLVVNAWLASRALYRAWQLRGYEREQAEAVSRTEQVIENAGLAADNAVTAAMDSAAAMSSAASAAKHTANAAGQAAGAAVGVASSVAAGVAAAVRSAAGALNGSAAAKAAPGPRVASANFEGNSTAGGVGAAGATAAAGHPHHQVAELPSLPDTAPTSNDSCAQVLREQGSVRAGLWKCPWRASCAC